MNILNLTLNRKWFDMIASGEKLEEYREIKPYWVTRFIVNNNDEECCYWELNVSEELNTGKENNLKEYLSTFVDARLKQFDIVSANNGYAKNCPNVKWLHKGIRIGTGRPEWGAEPGKQYFVLGIGELIKPTPIPI